MNATMGLVEAAVCVACSDDCSPEIRQDAEEFLRASWRKEVPWAVPASAIDQRGAALVGEVAEVEK